MFPATKQFDTFDNLSDRRDLMRLFVLLGDPHPEAVKRERRAAFLQGLLPASLNGFAGCALTVTPCGAVEAYNLLVAITGVLGVPIRQAAAKLEEEVRRQR